MVEYLRLLSKIAVYLGNGSGQAQGCYGSLMGSQSYPIDPVDFDVVKTDLERRDANRSILSADLTYAYSV